MKVFEMQVKMYSLLDSNKKIALEQISKLIDSCLMQSENMQQIHQRTSYKYYSFGAPVPVQKDGIYKKGNIYTFVLRTTEEYLAEYFSLHLAKQYSESFKLLTVELRQIKMRPIEKVYTLSPIILKFDTGYWKGNYTQQIFEKRLQENLIKKYNMLYKMQLNEDFELFNYIKFDNLKPVAFHYKDITLLGDKITVHLADNETAQKLGALAIGSGVGEMNARGAGFVNYKFL